MTHGSGSSRGLGGTSGPLRGGPDEDTLDPLDAAETLPRAALDARTAEALVAAGGPDATQEVAVENILLETYVDAPPRSSGPMSSASQALSASRRPTTTSSSRIAIPRPQAGSSPSQARTRSVPKMVAIAAPLTSTDGRSKTVSPPPGVLPALAVPSAPSAIVSDAPSGPVRIAAAIAACVPEVAPAARSSAHDLGKTPAPASAYAALTPLPPPAFLPPPAPSSVAVGLSDPPAGPAVPVTPAPIVAVQPGAPPPSSVPPASAASLPPYPRPTPLPLFLVSSKPPAPPKTSPRGLGVALFVAAGLVVGVGAFVAARRAFSSAPTPRVEAAVVPPRAAAAPSPSPSPVASASASPVASAGEAPPSSHDAQGIASGAAPPSASPAPLAATEAPSARPHGPAPGTEALRPSSPNVPAGMTLVSFPRSARGHRLYVDGSLVPGESGEPRLLKCGSRAIKIGSAGKVKEVDLPCGGTFALR